MMRTLRVAAGTVLGLGVLTVGAAFLVGAVTQAWFEKDVALRADLVVKSAGRALAKAWRTGDHDLMHQMLTEIARDERIMAALACDPDHNEIAATAGYPAEVACRAIREHLSGSEPWRMTGVLEGGAIHLSAFPMRDAGGAVLGTLVLVQDMSYVGRREGQTRLFLITAFAILAVAASMITLIAERVSWRSWTEQLRQLVRGGVPSDRFQPLLKDVRALIDRISDEEIRTAGGGTWTPERLKDTLRTRLRGERVVIVANREPYIHNRAEDGSVRVLHPASGLVTALEPVMRACSGVWIAHGAGTADRETADEHGRVKVPPGEESYVVRRVWLTQEEEAGYYYGFSNEGMWPLCHLAHTRPIFRTEDWNQYRAVNEKFARAVVEEVDSPDPIILVQDYHFALAPRMIRERLPRATILAFWHIPWPNAERVGICPWRTALLEGLLGSSIVGFHTAAHCNNFLDSVDRFLEARIDREQVAVVQGRRPTLVRAYPISIEWPSTWASSAPPVADCRASVFAELGLKPGALLGVGVDRLDYTKGIEERLMAVERLLERRPDLRGRFTFAQLAAPSRAVIERYRVLNEDVERLAARINRRFGDASYRPIVLARAHHEPPVVFRYYRAADLCYVSSLHDGMNLVAKEFVAAREDERGVLVLSSFTGAASELTEALIVNPYDIDEASAALAAALDMSHDEQRERMRAMRGLVSELNVYRWAGRMLVDAERLRRRDRLTDRLSQAPSTSSG